MNSFVWKSNFRYLERMDEQDDSLDDSLEHSLDENEHFLSYACAYCGEPNEVFADPSAGSKQELVEDCAVCCRPNVLRIFIDDTGAATVEAEYEG